jgi:glycosidase
MSRTVRTSPRAGALLFLATALFAEPPVITKVDPPDWMAEARPVSLRLLISGRNLSGASVRGAFPATNVAASGTHLFVDVTIPAATKPGPYPLEVETKDGTAQAQFRIVPALEPAGRFQGLSSDDVVYLIMPDRFANGDPSNDDPAESKGLYNRQQSRSYHGGDLEGVIQHLPYFKDLGVTALWLTPVYDNANRSGGKATSDYHGYGATDFYRVDEHLGTIDKFRELVDKAHAMGLKVIQDEVANHTGPLHPWVDDPPTPTWFNGTKARHLDNSWRIWSLIDPHASAEMQKSTLDGWFGGHLPDLNQNDPEVARYLIQNTLWWIGRTGIDCIREDTLPYAPRSFWSRWTAAIKQRYPSVNVAGEVFDNDPAVVSFFQGGAARFDGIDTGVERLFDFPVYNAIRRVFARHESLVEMAKVVAHDALYQDPSRLVTFLGLHDVKRFLNEQGASSDDIARAFSFLFSIRGTPMIYYGDEIGMRGGDDPDNRRDFPGGWTGDPHNAFERTGRTPEENRLFDHVRRLAALRKRSEPLRRGSTIELLCSEHAYVFSRVSGNQRVIAAFHDGPAETLRIPVREAGLADGVRLVDALGTLPDVQVSNGAVEIHFHDRIAAIYEERSNDK